MMPEIIAHRALVLQMPENTLEAIQEILKTSVDAIEIDVQLTKDSIPVLMHDESLRRAAGLDAFVWEVTLADLHSHPLWGGNHIVPTLEQVLHLINGQKRLFIEIKRESDDFPDPTAAIVELLKSYPDLVESERVIAGSYNTNCLSLARRLNPQLSLLGIADDMDRVRAHLVVHPQRIALWYEQYAPYIVDFLEEGHIIPWAFTVNSPQKARFLQHIGVQGLISDVSVQLQQDLLEKRHTN